MKGRRRSSSTRRDQGSRPAHVRPNVVRGTEDTEVWVGRTESRERRTDDVRDTNKHRRPDVRSRVKGVETRNLETSVQESVVNCFGKNRSNDYWTMWDLEFAKSREQNELETPRKFGQRYGREGRRRELGGVGPRGKYRDTKKKESKRTFEKTVST